MTQFLGQQVVVENRAGAAGNVGMDVAARGAPDGYTIFLGNVGTISINPSLFADLTVKPEKDFIPVSIVADTPGILIANPKFPPNNAKELVDYAKANQGKVNFASPGSGSLNRLEMEVFRLNAGLDMNHVPYKGGAGPAVADIMGGHVELMFTTISSAIQHVKGGRLKALGVTTKERVPALPDVPTMLEQGFPANVSSSWQGVLVPAGTPRPIVDKLHAALVQAVARSQGGGAHGRGRRDRHHQQVAGGVQGLSGGRRQEVERGDQEDGRQAGVRRLRSPLSPPSRGRGNGDPMKLRLSTDLATGILFIALGGFAHHLRLALCRRHDRAHGPRLFSRCSSAPA